MIKVEEIKQVKQILIYEENEDLNKMTKEKMMMIDVD